MSNEKNIRCGTIPHSGCSVGDMSMSIRKKAMFMPRDGLRPKRELPPEDS